MERYTLERVFSVSRWEGWDCETKESTYLIQQGAGGSGTAFWSETGMSLISLAFKPMCHSPLCHCSVAQEWVFSSQFSLQFFNLVFTVWVKLPPPYVCVKIGISDSLNTICSYVHCVLQGWTLISVFTNIYRMLFTCLLTITKLLLLRMFLFPSESSFWVLLFLSSWLVCIPFTFQTHPISSQVIYKESQWPSTVQLLYKLSWQNCGL